MKKVHWRPIEGMPLYWVSTDGRVRTFNKKTESGFLRPAIDKGYLKVALWNGNKGCTTRVHRLVAKAFKRPVPGMDEVNHDDGDKLNNNHWNLSWTDRLGNMKHAMDTGLRSFASGEKHGMCKLTDDQIAQIRSLIGTLSYRDIMSKFKIGVSHYYRIKNNQSRV
jgi:hypothetical protein